MFLKSMEMFGFKSFADRTQLEFEPGITVVVGPNGCGKSNVVDAIKWVLGEKQAKNIRGEKMEDIIFSGTEQRKPLSLAEVSMTINNKDRILDIDSDDVTVGRRVFRDGESEYLINRSPVRLKDIEKLFMDTGIGKSAYSVMEQGKMDLILSTRAEDRRYIFEEAAGISRYKLQKKESLKKLQDTSDNLERLNDIIHEIEREKDIKARQAEKTKEYLKLRSEQKEIDVRLQVLKYRDIVAKQNKTKHDLDRSHEYREKVAARVSSVAVENEKDDKRKNDIQLELFDSEKQLHAFRIRLEDIDSKSERNRQQIADLEKRNQSTRQQVEERGGKKKELIRDKEKNEAERVENSQRIETDRQQLKELFENRKSKLSSIHTSRETIETNRGLVVDHEKQVKEKRKELEGVIGRLIEAIDKRKAELTESEDERQQVRHSIHETLDTLDKKITQVNSLMVKGDHQAALDILETVSLKGLGEAITQFEGYEDGFRSILFDKTGVHAEKEVLDTAIHSLSDEIDTLRKRNNELEEFITREQNDLENINEMITRVEKDLSKNENERDWIDRNLATIQQRIREVEMQLDAHEKDLARTMESIKSLQEEIAGWEQKLVEYNEESKVLMESITQLTDQRSLLDEKISQRRRTSRKDEEELERIQERITQLDRSHVEMIFKRNTVEDYLWTEYELKAEGTSSMSIDVSETADLNTRLASVKKSIQDLGPINNLAIEELKDLTKRFQYYLSQKEDIEKAREDILSVIQDINATSIELFLQTFTEIKKNFSDLFKQLFDGGEAHLELLDPDDVLESGIEIMVRPPGKKPKNIKLLSGGERAMTAIALLFATYMAKPSPFCFLDEIDAPLDEENIGRFVKMMREFSKSTQFVTVTHNKKSMSIGESIYGVTMEEPGVSRVVSLKMEKPDRGESAS